MQFASARFRHDPDPCSSLHKSCHSNHYIFRRGWHGQVTQQQNIVMAATCAGPQHPPEQENAGLAGNPPMLSSHPQQSQSNNRFHDAAAHVTVSCSSQLLQHKGFHSSSLASKQKTLTSNSTPTSIPVAPTSTPLHSRATPLPANATAMDESEDPPSAAALTEVRLVKTKLGISKGQSIACHRGTAQHVTGAKHKAQSAIRAIIP